MLWGVRQGPEAPSHPLHVHEAAPGEGDPTHEGTGVGYQVLCLGCNFIQLEVSESSGFAYGSCCQ